LMGSGGYMGGAVLMGGASLQDYFNYQNLTGSTVVDLTTLAAGDTVYAATAAPASLTAFPAVSSPAALTADQNNYAPTLAKTLRLTTNGGGNRTITGLAGGVAGMEVTIVNIHGTNSIILNTQDGGSSAANHFFNGSPAPISITLAPGGGNATYLYDPTSAYWRLKSRTV